MHDSPLHKCANEGDTDGLLELLGVHDIDGAGAQGRTPLHRAIGAGHIETARALLEQKANPNVTDSLKRTALHWAAGTEVASAAKELCDLLLQGGFDGSKINQQSQSGSTALHFALSKHNGDAAKFLFERGADITIQDEDGKSCKDLAKEFKLTACLKK